MESKCCAEMREAAADEADKLLKRIGPTKDDFYSGALMACGKIAKSIRALPLPVSADGRVK